jgi:RNA polymerase sigma-70 factor (ECF subfamily)
VKQDPGRSVAELVRDSRDPRASLQQQQAAFTRLVERFEGMALRTAAQRSENLDAARDACQEAFLVAWRTLADVREPAAFGGWLKRLVRTQCSRARRRPSASAETAESASEGLDGAEMLSRREAEDLIQQAVRGLPVAERDAVTQFYFLGESLRGVARVLGVTVASAGKRLYSARLRLRRSLPRSIAETFLVPGPSPAFTRRVQAGGFDDFMGEYHFARRPDHPVIIRREGDLLVSYAGGQRNVLASPRENSLAASEFDGEARFRRNRRGRVSHFIYYEFGRRLGIARKVSPGRSGLRASWPGARSHGRRTTRQLSGSRRSSCRRSSRSS